MTKTSTPQHTGRCWSFHSFPTGHECVECGKWYPADRIDEMIALSMEENRRGNGHGEENRGVSTAAVPGDRGVGRAGGVSRDGPRTVLSRRGSTPGLDQGGVPWL